MTLTDMLACKMALVVGQVVLQRPFAVFRESIHQPRLPTFRIPFEFGGFLLGCLAISVTRSPLHDAICIAVFDVPLSSLPPDSLAFLVLHRVCVSEYSSHLNSPHGSSDQSCSIAPSWSSRKWICSVP
jgi:hypothetical protein